jgi:hypothetical protein
MYHDWVYEEGLDEKFPPVLRSNAAIDVTIHDKKIKAGIGLHDSSSALIPYLACFSEPFILISTGTWCISLNPFNDEPLTAEELQKDCLCYLEYHGRPVKAARLFAGNEHEQQVKILAEHFNVPVDQYQKVIFFLLCLRIAKEIRIQWQQKQDYMYPAFANRNLTDLQPMKKPIIN